MKTDTHPEYSDVSVKCSCGNAFKKTEDEKENIFLSIKNS